MTIHRNKVKIKSGAVRSRKCFFSVFLITTKRILHKQLLKVSISLLALYQELKSLCLLKSFLKDSGKVVGKKSWAISMLCETRSNFSGFKQDITHQEGPCVINLL